MVPFEWLSFSGTDTSPTGTSDKDLSKGFVCTLKDSGTCTLMCKVFSERSMGDTS